MNSKKVFKVVGFIALAVALVFIGSLLYFINKLPTAGELKGVLVADKEEFVQTASVAMKTLKEQEAKESAEVGSKSTMSEKSKDKSPEEIAKQKEIMMSFVNRYADAEKAKTKVCENLDQFSDFPANNEEFGKMAIEMVTPGGRKNPYAEAVFAPISYMFRLPSMQDLLKSVLEIPSDKMNDDSFIEKMGMFAKLSKAVAEITYHKKDIDRASDRGYRLFTLARVIQKNPSVFKNREVLDFCHEIESSVGEEISDEADSKEKADLESLIKSAGLSFQDVGYDPNYKTKVDVKSDDKGISVQVGWIDNYLGGDQASGSVKR